MQTQTTWSTPIGKTPGLPAGQTMSARQWPWQNRLLAALPEPDYERLLPQLELVPLPLGLALGESGRHQGYAYFPTNSLVSLLYGMEDGSSAEIAVVGNEGMVGVGLFMEGETAPSRAMVQSAGYAYRLKADVLQNEFRQGGDLQYLLLRYGQALVTHTALTAVCKRKHSVEQQLCRWLLLSLDRVPSSALSLTPELITTMLGRRAKGVAETAGKLQAEGLIHYNYTRGKITVLDRSKLEERVCECFSVIEKEFARLLPKSAA
jgi:CRP-like cAMP-binding protein